MKRTGKYWWVCGHAKDGSTYADSVFAPDEEIAITKFEERFMDEDKNLTTEFLSLTAKPE